MRITLDHLTLRYGSRTILDNISLDLTQTGLTAVMGPNGCGKTTLLRCIGGLLRPTSGQVLLDGKPVGQYPARQLAQRMALVRQQPHVDFEFTAFETVMMGRNPYQERLQNESQADANIVEQCMRQTGTWHLRDKRPNEMSGGELQRVMIARALAQQTPVLLMDEPVSNLDIAHQIDIMQRLRDMEDRLILIVIHDLNLARRYCQRLLLLHQAGVHYNGNMAEGLTPDHIRSVYGVGSHLADGQVVFDY